MRERPILFSSPMVRAILDGRKTQTRRVVTPPRWAEDGEVTVSSAVSWPWAWCDGEVRDVPCPYGAAGDRLWVKETWAPASGETGGCFYAADEADGPWSETDKVAFLDGGRWRASRFLPRWASRLTLDVVAVRVERLRDITEGDARAEGVDPNYRAGETARALYAHLWDQINGKRAPWASNPYVWVVTFRRAP